MFFISGKYRNKYKVKDTTDGVEEVYEMDDLLRFWQMGIDIKGLTVHPRYSLGRTVYDTHVEVYSDAPGSAKTSLLYGFRFNCSPTGVLTYLEPVSKEHPDCIVLSQFCKAIDSNSIMWSDYYGNVTFKFDDKIQFCKTNAFGYCASVKIDLRDVTNQKLLDSAYLAAFRATTSYWSLANPNRSNILDRGSRLMLYSAEYNMMGIRTVYVNCPEIEEFIIARQKKRLLSWFAKSFEFKKDFFELYHYEPHFKPFSSFIMVLQPDMTPEVMRDRLLRRYNNPGDAIEVATEIATSTNLTKSRLQSIFSYVISSGMDKDIMERWKDFMILYHNVFAATLQDTKRVRRKL